MKTVLLIIAGISALLSFSSCKDQAKENVQHAEDVSATTISLSDEQRRLAGIETENASLRQISEVISASGKLDVPPRGKVTISAPIGGTVKHTTLMEGSSVKKNDLIVSLENIEYIQLQQDYRVVTSQLNFLRSDYFRQEQLSNEEVNSKKTFEKAAAELKVAEARKAGLRAKLELLDVNIAELEGGRIQSSINIRSPIDGYVTKVLVNIGKYVVPNDIMFEIVNTEHLHAELTVFEKDIPKIKTGQRVYFHFGNETTKREASVYLIGKEIAADRSVKVHCHLVSEDKSLLPGMYLQAVVEVDSGQVMAVPDEAVIEYEGQNYLFSVAPDSTGSGMHHFILHEISAGTSENGYTHVELPEEVLQRKIVSRGAYSLLSQMKVQENEE